MGLVQEIDADPLAYFSAKHDKLFSCQVLRENKGVGSLY